MDNDLKSSEALKAYAREVLCGNNPTNSLLIRMFDEIIDNAPPVEAFTKEDMAGAYNEGYACGSRENKRPQGEWVPVSERLPERYKEVIVTDIETSDTYQSRYIGNGYWECDNGTLKNRIIAWQPLPEPYQEVKQE